MRTATAPLADVPALEEQDLCHIADTETHGLCGASLDCPESDELWSGQGRCKDCGRMVCPECAQLESKEIEARSEEWW